MNLLVVSDIAAAHDDLVSKGALDASEVFHDASGGYNRFDIDLRASGPDPQGRTYASFMAFSDPDGNSWQLQEVTSRLPGRVDSTTATFSSAGDLEPRRSSGPRPRTVSTRSAPANADEDWPAWYAAYMLAEQTGAELPS